MAVKRIVANVLAADPAAAQAFYGDALGLELVMDHGWIRTYAAGGVSAPQVSFASAGGSGAPIPDLSIEVDNLEEVLQHLVALGATVEYGPAVESWGVTRFFVRDPFGRLVNILSHE